MTNGTSPELAASAAQTAGRIKDGLAWVTTPLNAARVGDPTALGYRLRRASLRANRLARAASRKMCVAAFGPSQAGKSYMVSVLASPPGGRLSTELEGKVFDFLGDLNPEGGRESTGLVTRMTTDSEATPAGFPVSLRLLSQTELVKILANSFYLDFDLEHFDVPAPSAETIRDRIEELRALARPQAVDVLSADDVIDLEEYLKQLAGNRVAQFRDDFWREAMELAPRLEARDRARLWSLFWYDFQPFTTLFVELYEGLRQLGFAANTHAKLGALLPRAGSIIDVTTLDKLGSVNDDKVSLMPAGGSRPVDLPRALVAALTAELRITVKEKPSDVFDHTDLLDFPGARSRLRIKRQKDVGKDETGESGAIPQRELLLRGKVGYLFDGYAAEGEISAMLLCVPDSVQEVRGLSDMMNIWIQQTFGDTQQARAREKCGLFLVLTKMDAEFVQKEGVKDEDKDWSIRIGSSLLNNFRGEWPTNWDGRPFRNLYWLRNPTIHDTRIMAYDANQREAGVAEGFRGRYKVLHDRFVGDEIVRRHFENPDESWTEAFRENDGGIAYIVRRLAPICNPLTKATQVRNRLAELRGEVVRELERFHVAGDVQLRLAQRRKIGDNVMARLYDADEPVHLGSLLKSMQIEGGDLASYLYGVLVHGVAANDSGGQAPKESVAATAGPRARVGRARPGTAPAGAAPPAERPAAASRFTWERRAGREIMRCWELGMQASLDNPAVVRTVGLTRDLLAEISAELLALARRLGLEDRIVLAVGQIAATEQNEQRIAKAAMIGERFVNRLVSEMGFWELPVSDRPTVAVDGAGRPVFAPRAVKYSIDGWEAGLPSYFEEFFDDWANAFYRVIEDNAKSEAGLTIDVEQNDRLGRILADLRGPV